MVVGLFLRHYKIYKGANYIPFGARRIENLNLFIGQNGAGKSSILEALDTFFNNKRFIYHTNEKKSEAFVAPLFLIKKNELNKFSKNVQPAIPIISDFLFNVSFSSSTNFKTYKSFFDQQPLLKSLEPNYYLITCAYWPQPDRNQEIFLTFDKMIKKRLAEKKEFNELGKLNKLINKLKSDLSKFYSYQYIPVETSIEEFLRLESKGMQDLMSEDVKKRIEKTLNEKLPVKAGRTKTQSILDIVNSDLENFVQEIEKTIQEIDPEYDFKKEYKAKTRLTANHLTDVVVEAFFSKRNLKKSGKQIKFLSAGERKKALIDIAYAFLTQDIKKSKKVILAIDEPESSLHISMCYDQFDRLEQLANQFDNQLLITSHWYGSLPIIDKGNLYHIDSLSEKQIQISEFSFRNYFEDNGSHPNDVQFKSFFDLASAIISSLRVQKNNWLIVESEEDKNYINKHLSNTENLRILPVGGCAIVKLLYNYLHTPISQKSEKSHLHGKIFCLIDTDFQGVGKDVLPDLQNKLLRLRRLQVMENNSIQLHKIDTDIKYPTEIEEALVPEPFFKALKLTIEQSTQDDVKEAFSKFAFDPGSKNSFIKGDDSIIYSIGGLGENPRKFKEKISKFIDSHKKEICDNYCNIEINEKPKWIDKIEDFFE